LLEASVLRGRSSYGLLLRKDADLRILAMDLRRADRYVSDNDKSDLFKSQNLNDLKPYYNGDIVASRMAEIRKSIEYIRHNWEDRARFAKNLAEFLTEKTKSESDRRFMDRVEIIKSKDRNWGDIDKTQIDTTDFEAVRLYTSEVGYNKIFGIMNSLFRYDDTVNDEKTVQAIVFLVELINIDLYNFCLKYKKYDNFTGVVYRGVGLNDTDFDAFQTLMKFDIPKRYIAVPLCLMSSTINFETAKCFVKSKPKAVLFKIHVLALKPRYLAYYKQRNPTGVISSICAVNVKDLSDFPDEDEILLRGAFFQVLDFYKDAKENLHVLEVCMLNSNRDHLSSNYLTDPNARRMFGLMVAVTRNEFAVNFYKQKGNTAEASAYQACLDKAKLDLATLMPKELVE